MLKLKNHHMNTLNEFIFIASGITLTFTIVIIGLIVANSKKKTEIKKSHFTIKQIKEKWENSSIVWHKSDLDKDKTIKQLNNDCASQLQFKDHLIHGYKQDLKRTIELQDDNLKLKQTIEHLEKHCEKLQKEVDETTELNGDVAYKNQQLSVEIDELNQIIDEYSLFILNHAK